MELLYQTLNQQLMRCRTCLGDLQPLLPGDGQLVACSSPTQQGLGGEADEGEEEGRREQRGEWETESEGRNSNSAVKSDCGEATFGGQVEGCIPTNGPNRYKLCH